MVQLNPITFSYIARYGTSGVSSYTSYNEGIVRYSYPDKMTVERTEDTLRVAFSGHSTISDLYSAPANYFSLNYDQNFNLWIYSEKADIELGDGGNSDIRIKNITGESSFVTGDGNDNINILTSQYYRYSESQLITISSGDGDDAITLDTHENALDIKLHADIDAGNGNDYIIVELRGDNVINAGAGDDTIISDAGNDYIIGGLGKNIIQAGLGVDTIYFTSNLADYDIEVIETGKVLISKLSGDFETHLIQDAEYFEFADQTLSIYDIFDMPDNYYLGNIDDFTFNFTNNETVEIISKDTNQVAYVVNNVNELVFSNASLSYEQFQAYVNQDMPILSDGNSVYNAIWSKAEFEDGKLYLNNLSFWGQSYESYTLEFSDLDHVLNISSIYNFEISEEDFGQYYKTYDFTFNFGSGDDYLDVSYGYITVNAGAGDDYIESGWRDDILNGEDGNDSFNTGWGNDTIDGGEGNDTAIYNDLGASSGSLYYGIIADLVTGTVHKNGLYEDTLTNVENITGSDWSDGITGNDEDNILSGLDGQDTIIAGAGNDTLNGGQASDLLRGNLGDDTYIWNINDGNDVIEEEGGLDKIIFGSGITLSDINFDTQGNTLFIHIGDEYITIDKQYGVDNRAVDAIEFVDGGEIIITERMHLIGSEEAEIIRVFSENDSIAGMAGDDVLIGSTGNETFDGGIGNDTIDGGDGDNDTVDYSSSADAVYVNLKLGLADEGRNNVWNDTLTNIESAIGSSRSDKFIGNDLGNQFDGLSGDDNIFAYGGNDVIYGGDGNDNIYTGTGQDQVWGGAGRDYIYGDADAQTMYGGTGNDTITGKQGDDFIYGEDNDDKLYGDEGNDTIDGGSGRDYIYGGDGNDIIDGGDHVDVLYGERGDDIIRGGEETDYIYGDFQTTPDGVIPDDGYSYNDRLFGEGGNDIIKAGAGDDIVYGGTGNDQIVGHDGADRLYGQEGSDFIYGGYGNDIMGGGSGQDQLFGEEGDDLLIFGIGADYLYGGVGNDYFAAYDTDNHDNDMAFIMDWSEGDRIDIADLLGGYTDGVDDITQFVNIAQGSHTTIQVDRDGAGSAYGWDNIVRLVGITDLDTNVNNLINNNTLYV